MPNARLKLNAQRASSQHRKYDITLHVDNEEKIRAFRGRNTLPSDQTTAKKSCTHGIISRCSLREIPCDCVSFGRCLWASDYTNKMITFRIFTNLQLANQKTHGRFLRSLTFGCPCLHVVNVSITRNESEITILLVCTISNDRTIRMLILKQTMT